MERISIEAAYTGTTVLLTGGSGYVGSVVLEALLRKTRAARVYVLLRRSKDGKTAASRLASLLDRPLFHALRSTRRIDDAVALDGDLTAPRLGLSDADAAVLQREVSIILHAAADIRLELPIHDALTANVIGTRAVLALGRSCSSLRAFVHVSSCFVNVHQPAGSVVDERLYQLGKGTSGLDAAAVVDDLLALPPDAAELRATALRGRWGFPNNYTLSKHLAESHVAAAAAAAGSCDCRDLPEGAAAVIVRPSLVTAVLYDPLPGAIGNFAGPIGASAALAMGFYHSLRCVSSRPLHVWDVVPADIVANGIIAAGAAAATDGAARALAQSAAAAVSGMPAAAALPLPPPPLLIVQSSSSATWPLTLLEGWNAAADFIAAHPPRTRLSLRAPPTMTATFQPNPAAVAWHRRWTAFKVAAASMLLRCVAQQATTTCERVLCLAWLHVCVLG